MSSLQKVTMCGRVQCKLDCNSHFTYGLHEFLSVFTNLGGLWYTQSPCNAVEQLYIS